MQQYDCRPGPDAQVAPILIQTERPLHDQSRAYAPHGDRRPPGGEVGAISHGICPRHFRKVVLGAQGVLPKRRRRSIRDESNREALLPL